MSDNVRIYVRVCQYVRQDVVIKFDDLQVGGSSGSCGAQPALIMMASGYTGNSHSNGANVQ